jgi:molybdopterin-containing oxidoreductase family membrane subunit
MLVEVSFCITCYLAVLLIEYIPIIIQNKSLNSIKGLRLFGDNLHHLVAVFAGTGVFLSFFHQGSLGGMWGVLYGRPFAARDGFYIWPWTFFLFIFSAIAAGPCFTIICTRLTEFITRKKLVSEKSIQTLARISGFTLSGYLILRIADIIGWIYGIVPDAGHEFTDFFREGPYGIWLLVCEIIVFGIVPAIILMIPKTRKNRAWLIIGCIMNCTGVVLNRFIYVIVTLAILVMPFDKFRSYLPTWQEWGIALGLIGYGFLIFSVSYRYLPLFPGESELNGHRE